VLGQEALYAKACGLMDKKGGLEEARWTETEEVERLRERVRQLVAVESDERVKIWARVRVGGERGIDLARAYGYRNGAGVTLLVRRLEAAALKDRELGAKLENIRVYAKCKL
jgi:hypothetical protein